MFLSDLLALGLAALVTSELLNVEEHKITRFTRPGVSIDEVPQSNQVQIWPHPKSNVLASPVRARLGASGHGNPESKRKRQDGFETVNTFHSSVCPTTNMTLGSKNGATGQEVVGFLDTGMC